jgi:hypothetical protein
MATEGPVQNTLGAFKLAALCLGLATIAACLIIPQTDANRRLDYERQKLAMDLDQINRQTAVNDEFLKKIETDPQLAERLAERQMKFIRQGERPLPYKARATGQPISPFSLVKVPPPLPLPPYQPAGNFLAQWLLEPQLRLYFLAAGLFLVALAFIFDLPGPQPQKQLAS